MPQATAFTASAAVRREREAGQLDPARLTADAGARQLNPTPTQRDLTRRRARATRLTVGVAFPARSHPFRATRKAKKPSLF